MARPVDPLLQVVSEALSGRYEVRGELGRGGMAVVYRARQVSLGRDVALKVLPPQLTLDPEFEQRFLREARAVAALNHPHIVTIHDVGEAGGVHYIAMEFLRGEDLHASLRRQREEGGGPLTPGEAARVVAPVAEALGYAHKLGFVHRDVKSSNVFLCEGGRVVLTDFGIARAVEGTRLTQTGTALGTAEYMSPEQARGEEVDTYRACRLFTYC